MGAVIRPSLGTSAPQAKQNFGSPAGRRDEFGNFFTTAIGPEKHGQRSDALVFSPAGRS
jgi:hypothetical protein